MLQPVLLTYNLKPDVAAGLREICRAQDIRMTPVSPDDWSKPVGALAGIPVARPRPAQPTAGFDDEMLVMCHMLSDQLDAFLGAMRASGLRVPLKAVLTPTNVAWDSAALHDELAREHAAMGRRSR